MSNRRSFLRNALMGIAVSLLPKVLQPCDGVVEEETALNRTSFFCGGDPVIADGPIFIGIAAFGYDGELITFYNHERQITNLPFEIKEQVMKRYNAKQPEISCSKTGKQAGRMTVQATNTQKS